MAIVGMLILVIVLVLLQRYIYSRFWDKNLDIQISFSSKEATEGDTLTLTQELSNAKALPLPWVNAKFQTSRYLSFPNAPATSVTDHYYQNNIFSISRYQRIIREQQFLCRRRGYYRILNMDLSSNDIFFSKKMVKRYNSDAELTVLPRIIPYPDMEMIYRQIYGDIEVRRFTNPDPFAFRGIREYEFRDDFRHINFKASAQTGQLMVNIFSATAAQELVILLNLESYSDWEIDDVFEDSIRLAASVAEQLSASGLSVGLVSNGKDVTTQAPVQILPGSGRDHAYNILEKLARIDLSLAQEPFSRELKELECTEPFYLIISPHHSAEFVEQFENMLERGLHVRWILPVMLDTNPRLPHDVSFTRWEVIPHDKTPSIHRDTSV